MSTPVTPKNVIVVDAWLDNGALYGKGAWYESNEVLLYNWYATTAPEGATSLAGGVAWLYPAPDIQVRDIGTPRIEQFNGRYFWQDKAINFGLMFVLILPAGHTVTDPDPLPQQAKEFDGRIALYWKPDPNDDRIWWRLQPLAGELAAAVAALNGLHDLTNLPPLNELLFDRFGLSELRKLCFQLGVDPETFAAGGKDIFVIELIQHFQRRDGMPRLLAALRAERPDQAWPAG